MYHVPLAVQCIYGGIDEVGKDGDGKEEGEIHGRGEKVEIVWHLV